MQREYRSTDASAPTIGPSTTGSALAALRAILVGTAGIAYGSVPSAGWTEAFTGTNEAVFVNSVASGGTGCYVHIKDQETTSYRGCSIVTYSSMSDLLTGSNPTHTTYLYRAPAQHAANAVTWYVIADDRTFYVNTLQTSGGNTIPSLASAGDADSTTVADAFRYYSLGGTAINNNATQGFFRTGSTAYAGLQSTTFDGLSFGRDYSGLGSSAGHGPLTIAVASTAVYLGGPGLPARPAVNGATEAVIPAYVGRDVAIRARLRGAYYAIANMTALGIGEARSGGGLGGAGSQFAALRGYVNGTQCGFWIETALPW